LTRPQVFVARRPRDRPDDSVGPIGQAEFILEGGKAGTTSKKAEIKLAGVEARRIGNFVPFRPKRSTIAFNPFNGRGTQWYGMDSWISPGKFRIACPFFGRRGKRSR
jgi:hypothetical protein